MPSGSFFITAEAKVGDFPRNDRRSSRERSLLGLSNLQQILSLRRSAKRQTPMRRLLVPTGGGHDGDSKFG